jgi:hypothetical protein
LGKSIRRNLTILIKALRGVLVFLLERRISFSGRKKNDLTPQEIVRLLPDKMFQRHRAAHEMFLGELDVMRMLQISRRKLHYLRARRTIVSYRCGPKHRRTYYLLSNILDSLKQNGASGENPKF